MSRCVEFDRERLTVRGATLGSKKEEDMRISRGWFSGVAVLLALMTTATVASGSATHVRWDIITLDPFPNPTTVLAGGVASAIAQDGSSIVFHGSGTFVAPGGGPGTSGAVTGGGTWETFASDGTTSTGSGNYLVTGLVRWDVAPGTIPLIDGIGNAADARSGLAVLRIEYDDGSPGVLVVSCHLPVGTPNSIFEGVRASKGYVDYWNGTEPVGNTNRTTFHVQ
jgi:hypothetical protein